MEKGVSGRHKLRIEGGISALSQSEFGDVTLAEDYHTSYAFKQYHSPETKLFLSLDRRRSQPRT